jgi:hypothetical protein
VTSVYRGRSNDVVDGSSSYSSLLREVSSCGFCVSAFGREAIGWGAVGDGGIAKGGRPGGNCGGRPGSSPLRLSGLSSEFRGGSGSREGGWGWDTGAGISVKISEFGAGRIGGAGREIKGGGGGTVKGGSGETFAGSTSTLPPGTPSLSASLFSSGFRLLSEGDK